jgi:hypothetical protein
LTKQNGIANYREFVISLKCQLQNHGKALKEEWKNNAIKCVNGLAADELRKLVALETRREYGAFFTDSTLAKQVLTFLKPDFNSESIIYDPACGAGNLLISVWDYIDEMGIKINSETQLLGTDIHKEFVETTRLRLHTNALLKKPAFTHKDYKVERKKKYSIKTADALHKNNFYKNATHIFVNPPFNQIRIDEKLNWSKGKVSAAALFLDKIISYSNPGTTIIAILPDVLRSGTRYEKWRQMIKKECVIKKEKLLGQFDKYADVDVYAMILTRRDNEKNYLLKDGKDKKVTKHKTIQDIFDVCVGPVVDNRDEIRGPLRPYIVSKGLEGWSIQKKAVTRERKHPGKAFDSPFVVVKRTSRMGDNKRAVALIIDIPIPVYIDNHLIVLKPKSGKINDCKKVIRILKDNRTNGWLNNKIRCRHLTTKAISEIPIWK